MHRLSKNSRSRAGSVEAWMQEMENAGHLPTQLEIEQQLPAYTAVDNQISFTQPYMQSCCAFQKLDAINQGGSAYHGLPQNSPQFKFISWVVLARTPDQTIPEQERLTCPMVWCRAKFQSHEYVQLVNHLSGCPHLGTAEYNCPYHSRNELFMEPQLPQKPRHSKKRFLKNTFEAIVKLGSSKHKKQQRGGQSGAQSPVKRKHQHEYEHAYDRLRQQHQQQQQQQQRQRDGEDPLSDSATFSPEKPRKVIEHPNRPELGSSETAPASELDGQAVMTIDPREIMPSEVSVAKRRRNAAELPGAVYNFLYEMEGQLPAEFIYDRAELSDKRFSYLSHSSAEDFSTESPSPVSPVSPQMWYSTRDFDSPISPSEGTLPLDPWANVPEFIPSQQQQQSHLSALGSQPPSFAQSSVHARAGPQDLPSDPSGTRLELPLHSEWQQFGSPKSPRVVPSIRVDTSCSSGKSISESSPASSGDSSAHSPSRHARNVADQGLGAVPNPSLQIDAESRDPKRLVQELRGLFNTLFKLSIAKIHQSPPSQARTSILRSQSSAAYLFDCGFKGLHILLNGQVPQDFWQIFGLSLLAYACGLATSEAELPKQFPAIYSDLLNWSQAIGSDGDKRGYIFLVQLLWSPHENCFEPLASTPWSLPNAEIDTVDSQLASFTPPNMAQTSSWLGSMPQDIDANTIHKAFRPESQLLLPTLSNGVVTQLCRQFLDRYEYLSTDMSSGAFGSFGIDAFGDQTMNAAHNIFTIRNNILDPLALLPGLEGFRPIVNNMSLLLENMPHISIRYLELMLLQEAKTTGSKSPHLYRRFAEAVRRLCDQAAASIGLSINRDDYHMNDVQNVISLHQDLLMQANASAKLDLTDSNPSTVQTGKVPVNLSPSTSEAESLSSHRPFSWAESSIGEDSPTTGPSSMFMGSNSSDTFFSRSDPTLMNSYSFEDSPLNSARDTSSPFSRPPTSAPNQQAPTSQPQSTPPNSSSSQPQSMSPAGSSTPTTDSAEGTMTCKICGKVLAGKAVWLPSNMKRHMRELHTPAAKRLVCDVPGCGRAFLRNHNLAHHRKTVHGRGT